MRYRSFPADSVTIIDTFSKLSPAIDVRPRYTGADVGATLRRVTAEYGCPKTIRVDDGPEFISHALDLWAYEQGVTLDFSRPGKPTDSSFDLQQAIDPVDRLLLLPHLLWKGQGGVNRPELVPVFGRCQAKMRGVQT